MSEILAWIAPWLEHSWFRALLVLLSSVVAAYMVNVFVSRVVMGLARKTETDLDDKIVDRLQRPLFITVLILGVLSASRVLELIEPLPDVFAALLKSAVIILWSFTLNSISALLLEFFSQSAHVRLVQGRTKPLFEMIAKVLIVGGAAYLVLLSWNINVTAWLASAGVLGIAVGFAAKDTLANLFSGVFIMADAPYKLGDYVVLGSGERGKVTEIGIRSTRILTRDDIEIIVPNAEIGGTKIMNESGGPQTPRRVRCTVGVAYGSDVDQVRSVLMEAALASGHLLKTPEPRVRFRSLGDSGLIFQVMGWVMDPELKGRALDELNASVYNKLNEAGIEIPFPKRDLYIKEGLHIKEAPVPSISQDGPRGKKKPLA